jgi:hypothetical protein
MSMAGVDVGVAVALCEDSLCEDALCECVRDHVCVGDLN